MATNGPRHFEKVMRIIVLRVAADAPNGEVTTPYAKARAAKYFTPTEGDLKLNPKHGNEPFYYQIVGNVIGSHDHTKTSLYYKGYGVAYRRRDSHYGGREATSKEVRILGIFRFISRLEPF